MYFTVEYGSLQSGFGQSHLSAVKILAEVPNKHAAVLFGAQIHCYSIGAESDDCIESL